MIDVLDVTLEELKAALAGAGQPAYRADQVFDWVFRKGVIAPAAMANLPPALRRQLQVQTCTVAQRQDSADGTIKLLLEFPDGQRIECALIPTEQRATACVSTQAGCAMGCTFCASAIGGLSRNLISGEIIQQVLCLQQAAGRRVTHVVFMGTGEPLANYVQTVKTVRAIVDPERLNISARHVTVSTVGLPSAIRRLAKEDLPVTLAISLHAPNDALRRQLIPAAKRFTIDEVIEAAGEFFASRHREVTLEYIMIGGVNDTMVCAEALSQIARRIRCSVNLIRYNLVAELPYKPSSSAAVRGFVARLERRGVNVQVRRSRGQDIAAACGQLRRQAGPGAGAANDEAPPGT